MEKLRLSFAAGRAATGPGPGGGDREQRGRGTEGQTANRGASGEVKLGAGGNECSAESALQTGTHGVSRCPRLWPPLVDRESCRGCLRGPGRGCGAAGQPAQLTLGRAASRNSPPVELTSALATTAPGMPPLLRAWSSRPRF